MTTAISRRPHGWTTRRVGRHASLSKRRTRWVPGLPLLLVAAMAASLAHIWTTLPTLPSAAMVGLKLARDRGPTGPVEITAIDTELLWSRASQARATVGLENATDVTIDARVWWIVAPVGDPHPWVDPRVLSPTVSVTLPPHGRLAVPVDGWRMPQDGGYALSAWVHTKSGDVFVPSDGVALSAGLTVAAADGTLNHLGDWDPTLAIAAASSRTSGDKVIVQTTITNTALRPRTVRVAATAGREMVEAEGVIDAASSYAVSLRLPDSRVGQVTVTAGLVNPDGSQLSCDRVSVDVRQ